MTYNIFSQYCYIPYLEKWLSIFIFDFIECQRKEHFNMKIQTAPTQSFSEHAPSFNYRIFMDTKGLLNHPSHNNSYIHVKIDAFSHFVVTVPTKSNNAKTAIKTLLHHWIKWSCRSTKQKSWHTSSNVSPPHSQKIGLSKFTCMLMPIIHNHFQNLMFPLMKLSSTHNPESPLL